VPDLVEAVGQDVQRSRHIANPLTNPIYCGHIVFDGEVVARDCHEAAVDDATFERIGAKRTLRDRRRKAGLGNGADPIRTSTRGLLTPWLKFGSCGGRINVVAGGRTGARTFLYNCAVRQDNPAACPGISVRVEKLDALVLEAIERRVLTPENVQALLNETLTALASADVDEAATERERLAAQITELDRKIRRTADQVVNGLIDGDDAKVMNAPLLAQREYARLQRATLPSATPPPATDTIDPAAAWPDITAMIHTARQTRPYCCACRRRRAPLGRPRL